MTWDVRVMATRNLRNLELEIERLVRLHLEAQRRAAAGAVERAFASVTRVETAAKARPSAPGRRRRPDEMSGAVERLYNAVRANPGETMMVIAAQLGETRAVLVRPMLLLKRAGRVRSVGQRHLTRYFPMGTSRSA